MSTNTTPAAKPSNNTRNTSIHPAQQSSGAPSSLPPLVKKEVRSATNPINGTNQSNSPQTPLQQQQNSITPLSTNDGIPPQPNQQAQRKVTFSTKGVNSRPEPIASSSKTAILEPEFDIPVEEHFGYSEDDAFYASVDLGDLDKPIEDDEDIGRPIDFDEGQGNASMDSLTTKDSHRFHVGAPPPKTGPATGMLSALLPHQPRRAQQGNLTSRQTTCQDQNIATARHVSYTKRTATPSIGGFHFPPGMVCSVPR